MKKKKTNETAIQPSKRTGVSKGIHRYGQVRCQKTGELQEKCTKIAEELGRTRVKPQSNIGKPGAKGDKVEKSARTAPDVTENKRKGQGRSIASTYQSCEINAPS